MPNTTYPISKADLNQDVIQAKFAEWPTALEIMPLRNGEVFMEDGSQVWLKRSLANEHGWDLAFLNGDEIDQFLTVPMWVYKGDESDKLKNPNYSVFWFTQDPNDETVYKFVNLNSSEGAQIQLNDGRSGQWIPMAPNIFKSPSVLIEGVICVRAEANGEHVEATEHSFCVFSDKDISIVYKLGQNSDAFKEAPEFLGAYVRDALVANEQMEMAQINQDLCEIIAKTDTLELMEYCDVNGFIKTPENFLIGWCDTNGNRARPHFDGYMIEFGSLTNFDTQNEILTKIKDAKSVSFENVRYLYGAPQLIQKEEMKENVVKEEPQHKKEEVVSSPDPKVSSADSSAHAAGAHNTNEFVSPPPKKKIHRGEAFRTIQETKGENPNAKKSGRAFATVKPLELASSEAMSEKDKKYNKAEEKRVNSFELIRPEEDEFVSFDSTTFLSLLEIYEEGHSIPADENGKIFLSESSLSRIDYYVQRFFDAISKGVHPSIINKIMECLILETEPYVPQGASRDLSLHGGGIYADILSDYILRKLLSIDVNQEDYVLKMEDRFFGANNSVPKIDAEKEIKSLFEQRGMDDVKVADFVKFRALGIILPEFEMNYEIINNLVASKQRALAAISGFTNAIKMAGKTLADHQKYLIKYLEANPQFRQQIVAYGRGVLYPEVAERIPFQEVEYQIEHHFMVLEQKMQNSGGALG